MGGGGDGNSVGIAGYARPQCTESGGAYSSCSRSRYAGTYAATIARRS